MILNSGVGVLCKVIEACKGRWLCQPTMPSLEQRSLHEHWPNVGAKLPGMVWVVVVLL